MNDRGQFLAVGPFLNAERQLRNGWWIVIFFVLLASLLVPTLINAHRNSSDVSIGVQAILIMLTSLAWQMLRRKPLAELLRRRTPCPEYVDAAYSERIDPPGWIFLYKIRSE